MLGDLFALGVLFAVAFSLGFGRGPDSSRIAGGSLADFLTAGAVLWLLAVSFFSYMQGAAHAWGLFILVIAALTAGVYALLSPVRLSKVSARAAFTLATLSLVSSAFVLTTSLLGLFVLFEALLLLSLNLLVLTSKSERILEAALEMFLWTVGGSLGLLLLFLWFFHSGAFAFHGPRWEIASPVLSCCLVLGFGVKIPIWPALSWLLKAHVEASVEFSILLSGFIVKLGLVGLLRLLELATFALVGELVIAACLLAMFDATCRLFAQIDLKRVVALTTVLEMNWLTLCFVLGGEALFALGVFLAIAHCLTTISEFFLVECLAKRYGTRDIHHITGLWFTAPLLWYASFATTLVTIGFPFTSIFLAKFAFFSITFALSPSLFSLLLVLFLLVLPVFFVRLWLPVWFGLFDTGALVMRGDLTLKESAVFGLSLGGSFLLGCAPSFLGA